MLTAGTLAKAHLFNTPAKLDLFRDTTFELLANYAIELRAWAFFANHYHLIASFAGATGEQRTFLRHLHRELAIRLNQRDGRPGRKVMYQFWDSALTYEKSYLARLHYVHQNAVRHRLVTTGAEYPWCSARWFESNARDAFVRSVYSFKIDRLSVMDEF